MQIRYTESQQPEYDKLRVTTWRSSLDTFYSMDPGTVGGIWLC